MQPLQPEHWHVAACRAVLVLLLWTNLLGVTLLESPCSPGVFWTPALCVRLTPRCSLRFSVPTPFPLCAQKPSRGDSHTQQERGRGVVNIEHLEICVQSLCFTF